MKKILSLSLIAVLGLLIFTSATPKKKKKKVFKGRITYNLSYEGDALTPMQKSQLPTSLTVKVLGTMTHTEIYQGPAIITLIERPEEHVKITMVEIMDKKAGITEIDTTTVDTTEQFTTEIEYTEDTKEIAGYTCKKAVVTFTPKEGVDADEQTLAVYYCPELGGAELNPNGPYKGMPGRVLEFYQVVPGLITKLVATEIKKGGVNELVDFYFNADFKEFKTKEELMKYIQGQ
ncbi:MAG: hypothetical protein DSY76_07305 [Bacteroidetes bacterium]|nr:MAG: hypothetical protein DSY76_07305 [Bacteroidota bacterium]